MNPNRVLFSTPSLISLGLVGAMALLVAFVEPRTASSVLAILFVSLAMLGIMALGLFGLYRIARRGPDAASHTVPVFLAATLLLDVTVLQGMIWRNTVREVSRFGAAQRAKQNPPPDRGPRYFPGKLTEDGHMEGWGKRIHAENIAALPDADRLRFVTFFNNGPGYSLHLANPDTTKEVCSGRFWKTCVRSHIVMVRLQDSESSFRLWDVNQFNTLVKENRVPR